MENFKFQLQVKNCLRLIFGCLAFLLINIFLILSIPIYIFRLVVILLAKYFRPDLGEILSGVSCLFANDLFTGHPLRCNAIVNNTYSGRLTREEVKSLVLKNWIKVTDQETGQLLHPKLQQYAVKWLGFTFWKNAFDTFHIDNHVYYHETLGEGESPFTTEEDVINLTEQLLNTPFRPQISPWEVHLIQNYRDPKTASGEERSILLIKLHHSLSDGYSMQELARTLIEWSADGVKMPQLRTLPKPSLLERIASMAMLPIQIAYEVSSYLGETLRRSPWKVEDSQKEWYQYCAKSASIPVSTVADIKNAFGVTFTSVLLSAYSSAMSQNFQAKVAKGELGWNEDYDQVHFFNTLPIIGGGKTGELTNLITGSVFHIPGAVVPDPVKRLQSCFRILESNRKSVMPQLGIYMATLAGAHLASVGKFLIMNRNVSVGLTNLPGYSVPVHDKRGRLLISGDFIVGGNIGCVGVGLMIFSYNGNIRVAITAEKAILSRDEVRTFLDNYEKEIYLLHKKAISLQN